MAKLKRIGVLFFAKLHATIFGVLGIIAGVLYAFGGFFYELVRNELNAGTALAFLALGGMPLVFAGSGFVFGAVEAILYNLAVRWFGGIETDIEEDV